MGVLRTDIEESIETAGDLLDAAAEEAEWDDCAVIQILLEYIAGGSIDNFATYLMEKVALYRYE